MTQLSDNAALIIIDVQQGFDFHTAYGTNRNNLQAEANIARLLNKWRTLKRPIFHIKHNSTEADSALRPGQVGNDIKPEVAPQGDEPVIGKTVNSAFIGTDLEQRLRDAKIQQVVMVGLTTNHCVNTTTRMAGNFGFETYIVSDATAAFDRAGIDGTVYDAQLIHDTSLANLAGEFAIVITTDDLL
ncbi:MAG: cysteine hydrolase family protein [Anaerolineae bacterium]|nr:cysteine hydrolase family protein [Anaerolineae bacterium]